MFYASYDVNKKGDNIKGFYPLTHPEIPKQCIQITEAQRDKVIRYPNHFRVESGRLIQIKDTRQELQRRRLSNIRKEANAKNKSPIIVGNLKYFVDSTFLGNLNLNLSVCSNLKGHVCSLWAVNSSGDWEFIVHDKQMLIDVAVAFNSRRESISRELYGQSPSDT